MSTGRKKGFKVKNTHTPWILLQILFSLYRTGVPAWEHPYVGPTIKVSHTACKYEFQPNSRSQYNIPGTYATTAGVSGGLVVCVPTKINFVGSSLTEFLHVFGGTSFIKIDGRKARGRECSNIRWQSTSINGNAMENNNGNAEPCLITGAVGRVHVIHAWSTPWSLRRSK